MSPVAEPTSRDPAGSRWLLELLAVVGAALGILGVVVWLALTRNDSDPVPAQARLEHYQARVHYTVYYLGPRFHEWALDDAAHERSGRVDALYGTCSGSDTCAWPMDVINAPGMPPFSEGDGCRNLPAMRGVPVVSSGGDVWVFTGRSSIQLSGTSRTADLAAVRALRPVGGGPSTRDLPAPLPA